MSNFSFIPSWEDFTSDSGSRSMPLAYRGGDVYFVIHHAVNYRVQDTIALSKPGGKQVSMSFAIGPTVAGVASPVYCVYVVDESRRPYTTASWIDDQAITVEVSNLDMSANYPVAHEAKEWCALIAAWMHVQYGMPLDRWHVTSHQEVYARGWGSYATACPGPDLQAALDWIVARAIDLVNGVPEPEPEEPLREGEDEVALQDGGYIAERKDGKFVRGMLFGPGVPGGVIIEDASNIAALQAMGNLAGTRIFNPETGQTVRVGAPIKYVETAEFDATAALAKKVFA